jgi:spermidine synthase
MNALFLLVFLSGTAALMYEVLWLKELGLLFGNTAYAAATTISVFFLGMSFGGFAAGRIAPRLKSPLRAYGMLEIAIAVAATSHFVLLDLFRSLYSAIYVAFGSSPWSVTAAKFLLATGVLFPAAFLIGATMPLIGQHLIRTPRDLARRGTLLYGVNTGGAAFGVVLGGLILPPLLGFTRSYQVAIAINLLIGAAILLFFRAESQQTAPQPARAPAVAESPDGGIAKGHALWLAFASGFLALGLEVLWTRMFAQVFPNSVYTFSAILLVFLVALAFGSFLANRLSAGSMDPGGVLTALLMLSGLSIAASPALFIHLSSGLQGLSGQLGWTGYLGNVLFLLGAVLFVPALILGCIFPYLLKVMEGSGQQPGRIIGNLGALNTLGVILGSLAAGFVFIDLFGLWDSIELFAFLYIAAGALLGIKRLRRAPLLSGIHGAAFLGVLALWLWPSPYPVTSMSPREDRQILQVIEGSHATVTVLQEGGNKRLKVNNTYTLGDTDDIPRQHVQAELPLLLHPEPRNVFFLGLGTGITAGRALQFPIERLTACELLPEVVKASRTHYEPYLNGLFTDPRARVLVEDGRNYLLRTKETYDVIVADLFLPWEAGAGSLYTLEHFRTVNSRLRDGGFFVQWLPLYQNSWKEFAIIARTMVEAFEQVTLWRADFNQDRPTVALIGSRKGMALDQEAVVNGLRTLTRVPDLPAELSTSLIFMMYAGNLSSNAGLFSHAAVNTDNDPILEYSSPITERKASVRESSWFAGPELVHFYEKLLADLPPARDPFLHKLSSREIGFVLAGLKRSVFFLKKSEGATAEELKNHAVELLPDSTSALLNW